MRSDKGSTEWAKWEKGEKRGLRILVVEILLSTHKSGERCVGAANAKHSIMQSSHQHNGTSPETMLIRGREIDSITQSWVDVGHSNDSIIVFTSSSGCCCLCLCLCLGVGFVFCHLIELFLCLSLLCLVFVHSSISSSDDFLDCLEFLWFHFWLISLDVFAAAG